MRSIPKSLPAIAAVVYSTTLLLSEKTEAFSFSKRTPHHPFLPLPLTTPTTSVGADNVRPFTVLSSTPEKKDEIIIDAEIQTKEEKDAEIGNLVADDEWNGLTLELGEIIRQAVCEDVKKNVGEFIGKEDYEAGDISKEIDTRVKKEVAQLRGKEEYEVGDLVLAMDTIGKDLTCELSGKEEYEFGDLSNEIDKRVKSSVADLCGKEDYETGDLSKEMDRRIKERAKEFTGKDDYEFGDVSKELNSRREVWVENYLGKEAAANYKFGDVTKKALTSFTGKDEYQFGDVTKKLFGGFNKKKKE